MKPWVFIFIFTIVPELATASSGGVVLQCANYKLELIPDSLFKINGYFVTSQKIELWGEDGIKMYMGLRPAPDGNNYAFQYVHVPGTEKRWLHVEWILGYDAPRIIDSFPCKKVPD